MKSFFFFRSIVPFFRCESSLIPSIFLHALLSLQFSLFFSSYSFILPQDSSLSQRLVPQALIQSGSNYYVHPSDEPNSITVTPKLDGANFAGWSRSMRRAFGTKNKLPIIDSSIQLLDLEDPNYVAWERCNHMVHS